MVDFIITDFSNVRGGGNIVDTVPSAEDFIVDNCTISSTSSGVFVLTPGESLVDSVSLSVSPLSVTVGGSVVLTATVLDDEDDPLANVPVSFYRSGTVIGSDTSGSTGVASFTATMSSAGSFTLTAVAGGVSSSGVTVTVSKITSTISLSAVSSTISVGDSPQLTGTLSVGSGQSVKIYLGDVLVDTVTTGTNGAFSFTGSATSTSGSLTFKAVYDGDSTHSSVTSSNVVITVSGSTPVVTSVSLTSNKSILSAYDGEYATLSATVLDQNSNPVPNVEVEFFNGVDSMGTETTDTNGVAVMTYTANGDGDLTFKASIDSFESTVTIEDCIYYNTAEVSRTTTNGSTLYDSNMSVTLPTKCEISFDIWSNNSKSDSEHRYFLLPKSQYSSSTTQPQYALYFDKYSSLAGFGKRENNSSMGVGINEFSLSSSAYHTIKYLKNGTSVGFYVNGDLKGTHALSWIDNYTNYGMSMTRWSASGTSKLRNVKIKKVS